jgi:hypothetical protein
LAGISVVLGPVSNLFVIDVDGQEAHNELIRRLGEEPIAPKVHSGSGNQFRYHLYFAYPAELATKAKATPWHPKLEFKGNKATIVMPPSLHPSGRLYAWAPGRSPDDLSVPDLPPAVREALARLSAPPIDPPPANSLPIMPVHDAAGRGISPATAMFLTGAMANRPNWNERMFRAACDLCGRGWPLDVAESALLAGAQPWDAVQTEVARATIRSAFSRPREPSRH